jgi:MFS superfamily sulfate permease-like transporter
MSFFRIGQSNHTFPDRLCRGDYYQIVTSTLMLILGAIILIRSVSQTITIMTFLVGGGFLALGAYRLSFVVKYIKEKRKCSRR